MSTRKVLYYNSLRSLIAVHLIVALSFIRLILLTGRKDNSPIDLSTTRTNCAAISLAVALWQAATTKLLDGGLWPSPARKQEASTPWQWECLSSNLSILNFTKAEKYGI